MKVALIQSNFIPWRGYFDIIDDVELFIYHDDLQYTKGDWRNRNRIKTPNGCIWLTVPVRYRNTEQLIHDTQIAYDTGWMKKMLNKVRENYRKAEYFDRYFPMFEECLLQKWSTISELNEAMNAWILLELQITTPIVQASSFAPQGAKESRVLDILKKAGATTYLSGPSGRNYINAEKFAMAGIDLEYKVYEYEEYAQLSKPFEPFVTVLDLMFSCGDSSYKYLKSKAPNEKVL